MENTTSNSIINLIYDGIEDCSENTKECLICYDKIDETSIKIKCGHEFHYECIVGAYKMYTNTLRECPYCRTDGGYLELLDNQIPLKNIHREYNKFKKKKIKKNNQKSNNQKTNNQKTSNKISKVLKTEEICKSLLKSGKNKGNQCKHFALFGNEGYCGIHKKKE